MFNLGPAEIVLICGAGVLMFGHKLPDVARSIGRAFISFRNAVQGIEDDTDAMVNRRSLPSEDTRPPRKIESPTI
jgi:Sec-independent protein translocase protein TatA